MIKNFEKETQPITGYEESVLLPILVRGLQNKIGKDRAVTNKTIVSSLKSGYTIDEARVRKIINHIRLNGLVKGLIATSDGYYIATTEREMSEYEESLLRREEAIRAVRLSIKKQKEQLFVKEPNLFNFK